MAEADKIIHGMLKRMKRMGIDFGSKKIGIALSDDSGVMAFPHAVVPNDGLFLKYVEKLVVERGVKELVIGHSLNNDGEPNKIHSAVEEFMMDVTLAIGIPVQLEPEQYSSQQAMQEQGRNSMLDASAAALILDSYINKNKSK
jgi:putative holliday junction resolvase